MTLSREEIETATRLCATYQPLYRGPNPLSAGGGLDDAAQREAAVAEAWTAWAGFARTYFMAMLNTLAGHKPLAVESEIVRFCTDAEALGGRAATDTFWRRDLTLMRPVERIGAHAMNPVQRAILADDAINATVFRAVEQRMEAQIRNTLHARRGFLAQISEGADHAAGLQDDIAHFFGGGRPVPLSAKLRNENYDGVLFGAR